MDSTTTAQAEKDAQFERIKLTSKQCGEVIKANKLSLEEGITTCVMLLAYSLSVGYPPDMRPQAVATMSVAILDMASTGDIAQPNHGDV